MRPPDSITRRLALMLAVAAAYVLAGNLGLSFASIHANASPVWPPAGIALATLLVLGTRMWPAIFVGAFVVNVTISGAIASSLGIAAGNTLEAIAGAWLVHRLAHDPAAFERAREVFAFILAALASTTIGATAGLASLAVVGDAAAGSYGSIWLTWWLGDAAGVLVVAPFLILWSRKPGLALLGQRPVEAAALALTVLGAGFVVFGSSLATSNYPIAFVTIPPFLWASFRFGPRASSALMVALSAIAVAGTIAGAGPFGRGTPNEALLLLQAFLSTLAATSLTVAALVWERRQAEEAARHGFAQAEAARAEAEAANRGKDRFLAMLGHELRNPLGAISNAVHVLGRVDPDDERSAQAYSILHRQVGSLVRLVDDLLDVSRAMAGKIVLHEESLDLAQVVRHAVLMLTGDGSRPAARVVFQAEAAWVVGDSTRLQQVAANLIENALKFTPADGVIEVRVGIENDRAVLAVCDSGVGIAPSLLHRVFDPFVQADRSLDRAGSGLGVGLTIVRRIVELHGGTVEVASEGVGRGSRFTVRLPRTAPPEPLQAHEGTETVPATAARRVLVVEDNEDARSMLCAILRMLGHESYEAAEGVGGAEAALRLQPDLTLVDLGLPGIDGYEVARRIRRNPAGERLHLVALTGYGLPADRLRALAAGYDAHLVKPVDPELLARLLNRPCATG